MLSNVFKTSWTFTWKLKTVCWTVAKWHMNVFALLYNRLENCSHYTCKSRWCDLPVKLRTVLAVTCKRRLWRRRQRWSSTSGSLPDALCSYNHLIYAGTRLVFGRGRVFMPNICTRLRRNARRTWRVVATRDGTCCDDWRPAALSASSWPVNTDKPSLRPADMNKTKYTTLSSMSVEYSARCPHNYGVRNVFIYSCIKLRYHSAAIETCYMPVLIVINSSHEAKLFKQGRFSVIQHRFVAAVIIVISSWVRRLLCSI